MLLSSMLGLQRSAGNAAVAAMMARQQEPAPAQPARTSPTREPADAARDIIKVPPPVQGRTGIHRAQSPLQRVNPRSPLAVSRKMSGQPAVGAHRVASSGQLRGGLIPVGGAWTAIAAAKPGRDQRDEWLMTLDSVSAESVLEASEDSEPITRAEVQRCGSGCAATAVKRESAGEEREVEWALVQTPPLQRRALDRPSTPPRAVQCRTAAASSPLQQAAKRGPPTRRRERSPPDAAPGLVAQRRAGTHDGSLRLDGAAPTSSPHPTAGTRAGSAVLPVPRDDLDGHLDLLTGAAIVGAPVVRAAREVGQAVSLQRVSLNPLEWAKKIWNKVKELGGAALDKAKGPGQRGADQGRRARVLGDVERWVLQ